MEIGLVGVCVEIVEGNEIDVGGKFGGDEGGDVFEGLVEGVFWICGVRFVVVEDFLDVFFGDEGIYYCLFEEGVVVMFVVIGGGLVNEVFEEFYVLLVFVVVDGVGIKIEGLVCVVGEKGLWYFVV